MHGRVFGFELEVLLIAKPGTSISNWDEAAVKLVGDLAAKQVSCQVTDGPDVVDDTKWTTTHDGAKAGDRQAG